MRWIGWAVLCVVLLGCARSGLRCDGPLTPINGGAPAQAGEHRTAPKPKSPAEIAP